MPTRNILNYGTYPPPKIDYVGKMILWKIESEMHRIDKKYNEKPKFLLIDIDSYNHLRHYLRAINLEHDMHKFYPDKIWDMKIVIYPIKDKTLILLLRTPVQEICYPSNLKEGINHDLCNLPQQ